MISDGFDPLNKKKRCEKHKKATARDCHGQFQVNAHCQGELAASCDCSILFWEGYPGTTNLNDKIGTIVAIC